MPVRSHACGSAAQTTDGRLRTSPDATAAATHTAEASVTGTASTILAAKSNRKGFIVQNTGGFNIRVRIDGGVATATNGIQLAPGQVLQMIAPFVSTSALSAIREGGSSSTVVVVELV